MPLDFATGVFAAITTGGPTQAVVIAPAFQPKVVILFGTRQTADGFSAEEGGCFGAAVDKATDEEVAITWASDDALAASDTARGSSTTKMFRMFTEGSPTLDAEADISSFNTDGFTVSWSDLPATAIKVRYVCLGGADIDNVDITQFTGPAALATGNKAYTGVGFTPKFLLLLGTSQLAVADAVHSVGMIGAAASTTSRGVLMWRVVDASATANRGASYINSALCLAQPQNTGGAIPVTDQEADFVSFDADGFTLNHTKATSGSFLFWAISLGGTFQVHVGQQARPTALGTQDVTTPGFEPVGLMLLGTLATADATITTQMHVCIGAGEITGTVSEGSIWTSSILAATSDANMRTLDTKIYNQNTNPTTAAAEADLNLWLSNGYRLDWTTVDANARLFYHIALGSAAVAAGANPVFEYRVPMYA